MESDSESTYYYELPKELRASILVDRTVDCTSEYSHGTRGSTRRASRMSLACGAGSRVDPRWACYMTHMGADLPAGDAGARPCGLDGRLHLGLFAWHPGLNPTRKPHEPRLWSRLSRGSDSESDPRRAS